MCFKKFIQDTGNSRHNLIKTVEAFDTFWSELSVLCSEQKIYISAINKSNWSTPKGGNPVVSMERMLFILKNSRSLEDQFNLLNDITLVNYGAYYASRFEGFKAVSAEMKLNYKVVKQKKHLFSKNFNLYRVDLDTLVERFDQVRQYSHACVSSFLNRGEYCLVDCKNEELVTPFKPEKFSGSLHLYRCLSGGGKDLIFTTKPEFSFEQYSTFSFRFIGTQKTGITARTI